MARINLKPKTTSSGSSGGSSSGSSKPSSNNNSSNNSQSIIDQMKKNSEAWHTASEPERKRLEQENQKLGQQIGGIYNSSTGTWSNNSGGSLYGNSNNSSNSGNSSNKSNNTPSGSGSGGKASQTTYTDPTGNKQTGYIINGATYKDPYGNQRIDVGSIVSTAGGMFKLTDKGGVPYTGSGQQQQQTNFGVPQGAVKTTYKQNGKDVQGYIYQGKTYDMQGKEAAPGSIVTANNRTYLKLADGRGIDITNATLSELYSTDEEGNLVPKKLKLYNVGGTNYDEYGNIYRNIANDGEYIRAANKRYYDARTGEDVTDLVTEDEVPQVEDPEVQKLVDRLMDMINQEISLDPTMSLEEAFAKASETLKGSYNSAMDTAMQQLDKNALQSGFFGQLPTEALKRNTAANIEIQKQQAINELANQLFGQSQDEAYKRLDAANQQKNSNINNLLNMLGIYQNERAYGDSRADTEWEKALKEAQLTGSYKGQPTLDFLQEQRITSKQSGGGSGSGSSSGSTKETKSNLTKTETMKRIKDMAFSDAYKELKYLYNQGQINESDFNQYADIKFYENPENQEILDRYRTAMGRLPSNQDRVKYLQANRPYINEYIQNKLISLFGLN